MISSPARGMLDPIEASDLRRSRGREVSDIIASRSEWLLPDDRALLLAIYRDDMQASEIARLRGDPVRVIRRRIRVLIQRVLDPTYVFVLRHRQEWPTTRRRVATARFLQGRSLRSCAAHLRISLHTVRRHVDAVRLLEENHGGDS
jgi:DNA-directed RNA polymerase specialized sigma24 family protein